MNRAAVNGLLEQLGGKASIAGAEDTDASDTTALTSHVRMFDGVAYIRVEKVAAGLQDELTKDWRTLGGTNNPKGLALDLRFAGGHDFEAAAATAGLFTSKEGALLNWGDDSAHSAGGKDLISVPVAVLVNHKTRGAAEALAAAIRETGAGLIFGNTTAGTAMVTQSFPLKDGQQLVIATQPVKLGDGTALTAQGVKPDIEVAVSLDAEHEYLDDAYALIAGTTADGGMVLQTNLAPVRSRITEADLVRERREGVTNLEDLPPTTVSKPQKAVIRDPVLARAVDLLKGLAVVRGARS